MIDVYGVCIYLYSKLLDVSVLQVVSHVGGYSQPILTRTVSLRRHHIPASFTW
jgi:hypothetical protein